MKKLFVAAVCAVFALTASAQRASSTSSSFFSTEKADEGVRFGVRAGLNFANLSGDHLDLDSRTSFHVGVIADIPLMQSLYIQTGLYFQSKGAKNLPSERLSAPCKRVRKDKTRLSCPS